MILLRKAHPATRTMIGGDPTPAQAAAGKYPKLRDKWHGLTVAIEHPEGTVREGVDETGKHWRTVFRYAYGEILGTTGLDGDPVDVFIGNYPDAPEVYVVQQMKRKQWDVPDEQKCMINFASIDEARDAYLGHYDDPRFFGGITAMPVDEFVAKVRATKDKPAMIKSILFFKGYVGPYLRGGRVVNISGYRGRDARATAAPGQMSLFDGEPTHTEPTRELIAEHERLVGVLNSPSHADDKAEAKRQAAELTEMKQEAADPEAQLRAMWTKQGVSKERQDELIAQIDGKAAPGAKVGPFTVGGDVKPQEPAGFDPEKFDRERGERIKASREAGNVHLDRLPMGVEAMRGKKISYVHGDEKGTITTVTNRGAIYVRWDTGPMAGRESFITDRDAKDYVVVNAGERYSPDAFAKQRKQWAKDDAKPKSADAGDDMEKYIKVAADSIDQLRKIDVMRVLESNFTRHKDLARYIAEKRPDLAQEVKEVMEEEFGAKDWQAAATPDHLLADIPGAKWRRGKGLIAGHYGVEVNGEGVGNFHAKPEDAIVEAKQWMANRAAVDQAKTERAEAVGKLRERLMDGGQPSDSDLKLLGLREQSSGLEWFIPAAAEVFGITSRAVRPLIAEHIRVGHTDMGVKKEFVKPKQALLTMATALAERSRQAARNADYNAAVTSTKEGPTDDNPRRKFYVTIARQGRGVAKLAGPFDTHDEAKAHVDRAREEAYKLDPRSHFDAFGTAGVEADEHKPGVLNERLGIKAKAAPYVPVTDDSHPAPIPRSLLASIPEDRRGEWKDLHRQQHELHHYELGQVREKLDRVRGKRNKAQAAMREAESALNSLRGAPIPDPAREAEAQKAVDKHREGFTKLTREQDSLVGRHQILYEKIAALGRAKDKIYDGSGDMDRDFASMSRRPVSDQVDHEKSMLKMYRQHYKELDADRNRKPETMTKCIVFLRATAPAS